MRGGRGILRSSAVVAVTALAAAGCGAGRQDADEPSATYTVDVVRATFATRQHLAERAVFAITVRNTGREAIPDLAVTLHGFSERSDQPGLSDPGRPLWVIGRSPAGSTAYDDTWTAGALAAGREATLRWSVTPVVAGRHVLRYEVAAGLDGRARARTTGGRRARGTISVRVDSQPAPADVDPATGDVVRGR